MTWWERVKAFEPALLRAILAAAATVAATVGLDLSGVAAQVDTAWVAVYAVLPLVVAWWTRSSVTPNAKVVEIIREDGIRVAGEASPMPTGMVIDEAILDDE
jgi:hypothetical protein